MVIVSSPQLYLTLSELDETVVAATTLAPLYKAYAQTKLSEAGVFVDLDDVCGCPRPLNGVG